MATITEDKQFNNIIQHINNLRTTTLNAYTCDLGTVGPSKGYIHPDKPIVPDEETKKQEETKKNKVRQRHGSMVQNTGISAYARNRPRSHHRMASTGVTIRMPYKSIQVGAREHPPILSRQQKRPRAKQDAEYVQNMLDQATEARINAEQDEQVLKKVSAQKLERIQQEERLLRTDTERDVVRKHVGILMKRKEDERQGVTKDEDYNTKQDELYQLWHQRNSHLMTKKSDRHPERQNNDVVERYYNRVRRSSVLHATNAKSTMKGRMDVFQLLGVEQKPKKEEKVVDVNSVFGR